MPCPGCRAAALRLSTNSRHTPPKPKRGIQYAAASRCLHSCSGILDRPPSRAMTAVGVVTLRRSKLFRAGIDDLPELFAVLDLLHLGGQPAVATDPVLHRIMIIGHQV